MNAQTIAKYAAIAAVTVLSLLGTLKVIDGTVADDIRVGVEEGICPPCPADTDLP